LLEERLPIVLNSFARVVNTNKIRNGVLEKSDFLEDSIAFSFSSAWSGGNRSADA